MELLFVALGGIIIGLAVRAIMPGKDLSGIALIPGIATTLIVLLWEAFTWMRLPYNGFLIWGLSFGITIAATFGAAMWLTDSRRAAHTTRR
jgi:quaternary ammonium compound-resistance protein SugE